MSVAVAAMIWLAIGAYVLAGAGFAVWLLAGPIARLDPQAANAPWRVKLLILPELIALWPVLAARLRRSAP